MCGFRSEGIGFFFYWEFISSALCVCVCCALIFPFVPFQCETLLLFNFLTKDSWSKGDFFLRLRLSFSLLIKSHVLIQELFSWCRLPVHFPIVFKNNKLNFYFFFRLLANNTKPVRRQLSEENEKKNQLNGNFRWFFLNVDFQHKNFGKKILFSGCRCHKLHPDIFILPFNCRARDDYCFCCLCACVFSSASSRQKGFVSSFIRDRWWRPLLSYSFRRDN